MASPEELTTEELNVMVDEARQTLEQTEARLQAKVDAGEELTALDFASLKLAKDTFYYGVSLQNKRSQG